MAKRSNTNWGTGYTGSSDGIKRDALVDLKNSNAWGPSATRRSLPAAGWVRDPMDLNSPKERAESINPKVNFYLDSEDDRSR